VKRGKQDLLWGAIDNSDLSDAGKVKISLIREASRPRAGRCAEPPALEPKAPHTVLHLPEMLQPGAVLICTRYGVTL
jgi:hypothetical protein